ncbi:MAG: radical SAM family heme chaperone HemW [Candidatus Rokubacteria bacterium]|nr:radical SAM family heme chaperone HemW [Candidatus Rokubacteria bacterium]
MIASPVEARTFRRAEWEPSSSRLGVYVHAPFCAERCGYCSFNTAPFVKAAAPRYVRALLAEIDLVAGAPWAPAVWLRTVFVGGGTPSLLTVEEMTAILGRLRARFRMAPDAEITVEANPESVTEDKLGGYRAAGVTRLSLGVQSLDDGVLPRLDRRHTASEARAAYEAARAVGFASVSADLMYGLPGLDLGTWTRTVGELLDWEVDHLSAYALTLDEGSLWHARGVTGLPAEETVTAQYRHLAARAHARAYEHYEVSNWARPGHRSAHNQIYWRGEEYLGLGPGACGFLGRIRHSNVKPVERYCALLERGEEPLETAETLTPRQRLAERLLLGLRTADGIPAALLEERVALEPGHLPSRLAAWRERGLLVPVGDRVRLTDAGFLLSDSLFVELL